MKKKVLIIQPIHERGVAVFGDAFDVRVASDPSVATVKREIKGVEGVIVRMAPFTREIIEAADALKGDRPARRGRGQCRRPGGDGAGDRRHQHPPTSMPHPWPR